MDFLTSLQTDVKLLVVAGALALAAALFSGTKKNEYRYMVLFAVFMAVAGVRYHTQTRDQIADAERRTDTAVNQMKSGKAARSLSR